MKKQKIFGLIVAVALVAVAGCAGCTVVSANRTFPKLSWYWSADAKAERASRQAAADFDATNSASFDPLPPAGALPVYGVHP